MIEYIILVVGVVAFYASLRLGAFGRFEYSVPNINGIGIDIQKHLLYDEYKVSIPAGKKVFRDSFYAIRPLELRITN